MAALTYKAFVDRMISKYEGGYGWNKSDPGGPTKFGITCYDLAEHRGQKMDSMARWAPIVQAMELAEAEAIYQSKYANAVRYSDLPAGVDEVVMDYGVNSGTARVLLVLHRLFNIPGSGMSPALLAAIQAANPVQTINQVCAERLTFMHGIRGGAAWAEFGGGWGARVADLKAYATHAATTANDNVQTVATPAAPVDLSKLAMPKATHVAKTAGAATTTTAVTAGTTSAVAGFPHWVSGVIVAGVFLAGVAYEAYQDVKANNANTAVTIPPLAA